MATGGEDNLVNIWAVGKTTPLTSLSGLASSIESVALDWNEELLVAGSSLGSIKLWDLEQARAVRSLLTPHNSESVKDISFHPFGDFFASLSNSFVKVFDFFT